MAVSPDKKWYEISKITKELEYPGFKRINNRASIEETFMKVALDVSKRSPDAETQVGAVIVSPDNRILSTGYNGFPRDINYSMLPNVRPYKYPWMKHAESNALAWCPIRPIGCTIYVTCKPCQNCLTDIWQHGIEHIVEAKTTSNSRDWLEEKHRELFLLLSKMIITEMDTSDL